MLKGLVAVSLAVALLATACDPEPTRIGVLNDESAHLHTYYNPCRSSTTVTGITVKALSKNRSEEIWVVNASPGVELRAFEYGVVPDEFVTRLEAKPLPQSGQIGIYLTTSDYDDFMIFKVSDVRGDTLYVDGRYVTIQRFESARTCGSPPYFRHSPSANERINSA